MCVGPFHLRRHRAVGPVHLLLFVFLAKKTNKLTHTHTHRVVCVERERQREREKNGVL